MARGYIPRRGDLVWIDFSPQAGREQAGHRPALVISPRLYNARAGLALFCPVTSRQKGYPFEVVLPPGLEFSGVVLTDQIKSLDFAARGAKRVASAPDAVVQEVLDRVTPLVS